MMHTYNLVENIKSLNNIYLRLTGFGLCRYNLKKLTYEERKAKLIERLNALNAAAGNDDDDDEEDDE